MIFLVLIDTLSHLSPPKKSFRPKVFFPGASLEPSSVGFFGGPRSALKKGNRITRKMANKKGKFSKRCPEIQIGCSCSCVCFF